MMEDPLGRTCNMLGNEQGTGNF